MKIIAVPLANGMFCSHFGGAEEFALVTVDEGGRSVATVEREAAPPHERGAYPVWLRDRGVTTVLAAGMGGRAAQMLSAYGVEVVTGVQGSDVRELVASFLAGSLASAPAVCSGGRLHSCGHHDH